MASKAIVLVQTRRGCQMMEKEDRYDVMFNGELFDQLYFNMRGYVGYLPSPPDTPGGKPMKMNIGEKGISAFKKEVANLNKEWAALKS